MKRGVSPVIATVLLLVISVILVAIIAAFLVPFVRDSVDQSSDCFKVLNKVRLVQTEYSCYTEGANASTGFSVQVDNVDISGFTAILYAQGRAEPFDILRGTTGGQQGIRMLEGLYGGPLEVPLSGGLRTYVAKGTYTKVEVAPILESGTCEKTPAINILPCVDPAIAGNLTSR